MEERTKRPHQAMSNLFIFKNGESVEAIPWGQIKFFGEHFSDPDKLVILTLSGDKYTIPASSTRESLRNTRADLAWMWCETLNGKFFIIRKEHVSYIGTTGTRTLITTADKSRYRVTNTIEDLIFQIEEEQE